MSFTPSSSSTSVSNGCISTENSSEPDIYNGVAVVGMACRVAGGVQSPEQLWDFLLAQEEGVGTIPPARWEAYYNRDPRNERILKEIPTGGYFVHNLDDFDPQFFGISPNEAKQMDPQQRLSLEVAWEALQDAGISAKSLKGTNTSVFWGVNSDDYARQILEDLPDVDAWMGIGTAYCGVPNRISYHLDLVGESTAVDAACASSLVAVHHGVSAILAGESNIAIVGGVNALYGPALTAVLQKAGALASDGRCRSFDDGANGYGRGEGAGAIILKNHAQAIRDGDFIVGIVRGTAVAHDGKTNGIMAPNSASQALVARKALRVANLDADTIQYIEAHATSTPLGDPTEVSALSTVYGSNSTKPCFIGSIKPNIGHLEAGAGVMGMIKAVLAVEKGILPPQTNLRTLNTRINWESSGLEVVQKQIQWPQTDRPRRAAVCSYGYGGTVSHAIIEQHRGVPVAHNTPRIGNKDPMVLLLSAPHEKRLPIVAECLSSWLRAKGTEENLADICTTLATRRDHFEFRASAVIEDVDQALKALDSLRKRSMERWMAKDRCLPQTASRETVWIFSGHGAQWTDMGKKLLHDETFFKSVQPLDAVIQKEIQSSPIEWLRSGDFHSADRVQILTYLMQIGISAVLQTQGLLPGAIIGHSVGEIAASVVAGALSPVEGALVVTRRAVLYRRLMDQGGMLLVNKSPQDVAHDLKGEEDVFVAIKSSPLSCVIAGAYDRVNSFAERYKEQGIKTFRVNADVPFHTPVMASLRDLLRNALQGSLNPRIPSVKLYSTALSDPRSESLRDAEYWLANMINPVNFTDAVDSAVEDGYRIFLEVSSHPLVSHSVTETLLDRGVEDMLVVPTLRKNQSVQKSILHCLAQLHCGGVEVDWVAQMPGPWARGLPTGPWLHQPILRSVSSNSTSMKMHDVTQHSLLGHRISVAGTDTVVYSTILNRDSKPFPGDHPVSGTAIVPAACLLNTFFKGSKATRLSNVSLKAPVPIDIQRAVQVVLQGNEAKIMSQIRDAESVNDYSWLTHTTASWTVASRLEKRIDLSELASQVNKPQSDTFTVDYLAGVGVPAMGFPWKVLEHYGDSTQMLARVDVDPAVEMVDWDASSWAPLLDAATSIGSCIFFDVPRLRMPSSIQQVDIFSEEIPPKLGWIHVRRAFCGDSCADVQILDDEGVLLVKISSMQFSEIHGSSNSQNSVSGLVHRVAWPPATFTEEPIRVTQLILVSTDEALMKKYASSLPGHIPILQVSTVVELNSLPQGTVREGTAIAYIPAEVISIEDVYQAIEDHTWELLEITKLAVRSSASAKVFVLTTKTMNGESPAALANAPLVGLSRVIASEHPDNFGGFIDGEDYSVPLMAMKYVQDADVVRIIDQVPRTARLRTLPPELRIQSVSRVLPHPEGTYLITGGLGALGLATAGFLVDHGAKRLVLLSRRSLPPRATWGTCERNFQPAISRILDLEKRGIFVHTLSLDIAASNSASELLAALNQINLPPVLGVVHAAGVLENELIMESTQAAFHRVFAPKIRGALALHQTFPPGALDFFMLFSSCGQLLGFPGQGSYGSANAFLDTLATHRRKLGENSVAFQWSSWRGMGMGNDSDFVAAELRAKGITDITASEAFQAWSHLTQYDLDHGVVLRTRELSQSEPVPSPVLRDIVIRSSDERFSSDTNLQNKCSDTIPSSGSELATYLDERIRSCVGNVLQLSPDDVDSRAALSDLGLDSVMSVAFRRQLQQTFNIPVPSTLAWNHPTVKHLAEWFAKKLSK